MSDTVLAVDFGTSNTLAGAWKDGKRVEALKLDPAASDPTLMRTLLYFRDSDLCFYGADALQKYLEYDMEGRLFRSFKSHLPNRKYIGTFVEDRPVTLESMVGIFMLEVKKRAENILGEKIERAVVGRPARYSLDPESDKLALHRMKKAVEFAGFKEFEFVPEPLAAAFDMRRNLQSEKVVLVADFGGGTSDFTIIRIGAYDFKPEHVLGLEGCPLAGDALDSLFMSRRLNAFFGAQAQYKMALGRNVLEMPRSIIERLNKPAHIAHLKERETYEFIREVRKGALNGRDIEAIDRLFLLIEDQQIFSFFEAIESCKRTLSDVAATEFVFDYPGLELQREFRREHFEGWAKETKENVFAALDQCLVQASLTPNDVDLVCVTGGSARVPLFRAELEMRFGAERLQTQSHFHSVLSGLIESAGM